MGISLNFGTGTASAWMVGVWNEGHPLCWHFGEPPNRLQHLTTVFEEQGSCSPLASVSHSIGI